MPHRALSPPRAPAMLRRASVEFLPNCPMKTRQIAKRNCAKLPNGMAQYVCIQMIHCFEEGPIWNSSTLPARMSRKSM